MEDLPLWVIVYVTIVYATLAVAMFAPFFFAMNIGKRARWVRWKRLLVTMLCWLTPPAMVPIYQIANGGKATWNSWLVRILIAGGLIFGAVRIGDSYWMQDNEFLRDTYSAAVLVLSQTTVSVDGRSLTTISGENFLLSGTWRFALFLSLFGAAIGILFLRYTSTVVISFAAVGLFVGALLSINHAAWCVDLFEAAEMSPLLHDVSSLAHFSLPLVLVPWLALLVLSRFPDEEQESEHITD